MVECEDEADRRIDRVLLATALCRNTAMPRSTASTPRCLAGADAPEPRADPAQFWSRSSSLARVAARSSQWYRGLEISVPLFEEPERPAGTDELGAGLEPLEQLDGLNADLSCFAAPPGTPENAGERAQGRPLAASISELPIAGDCCP